METSVANAITTAATGLTAPAPVTSPSAAPDGAAASPHVALPKHDLGASPQPGGKSRDEVIRALADGKGAEQQNDVTVKNADNAAIVKVVNVDNPAGELSSPDGAALAAGTEASVDASAAAAQGADAAGSAIAEPPSQEVLEMGTDVGTGDALFRVRDKATGQWKAAGADVIEIAIRDERGEVKTYEKTLPELARMARDGVFGMKLQKEVKYYRESIPAWQQTTAQLQQKLDAQMQLNREMLSSEEKYLERREQFAQEMAPDKRVERLQAQLDAVQQQKSQELANTQLQAQVQGFYQTRIQPVVNEAMKVLPPEMIIGRINTDTLPLMVNGVIPPQHWQQYEAYVRGPFAQWAKAEGAKWSAQANARETSAAAASAAQKAAQKAKQEQARTMQPVGKVAPVAGAPAERAALPPSKNKREALDRLVSRPLEG